MTRDARIAFSEVVRVMMLLTKAETPHAKELAILISVRLLGIEEAGDISEILPEKEIEDWIQFARSLKTQYAATGGKPQ